MAQVQFKKGLYAGYAALGTKNADTLYFCTDTQQIFMGETEYTRPVLSGEGAPTSTPSSPKDIFYFDTTNKDLYVSLGGAAWSMIVDGGANEALQGAIDTVSGDLADHIADKNNPHGVTPAQIGAATVAAAQAAQTKANEAAESASVADGKAVAAGNAAAAAQKTADDHIADKDNPHGVTKAQVGLGNVDNTSDANKPVSTAQATAIADAKKAGTDAQTYAEGVAGDLADHEKDTTAHITGAERTKWNKASTDATQALADAAKALTDAKAYADQEIAKLDAGNMADAIEAAQKAADDAMDAAEAAQGTADANAGEITSLKNNKADKSVVEGIDGRLQTAEDEIDDLQAAITGLTGAMHFRGTVSADPTKTAPSLTPAAASGDVVLFGSQEYVYDGSAWKLFGDEGSYALKDQVAQDIATAKQAAIDAAAADATSKANAAQSAAVADAKSYTDGQISSLKTTLQKEIDDDVAAAKTAISAEIDADVKAAKDALDGDIADLDAAYKAADTQLLKDAKAYADTAEADAVSAAATDAKNKADAALASAKTYADQAEADAISTAAGDATTKANKAKDDAVAAAKTYTDTAISTSVTAALTWGSF